MARKQIINVPINRVEGDLEVRVELDAGRVSDAWCAGIMYRGFEQIMVGRGALDGLVITPRVCGICGVSHLTAAARALDAIAGVQVPPDATRLRNVSLMAEHIQSDIRHAFLMFTVDFVNRQYQGNRLFSEAVRRYEPFKGESVVEAIRETKKILEIVAIIGGQWPHSSFMVPGGIASVPSRADLVQCRMLLEQYRKWYERRVLGCPLERWQAVRSGADLEAWLEENEEQRNSDLGFYIRYAREIGLDAIGRSHGNFISYGYLDLPEGTGVTGPAGSSSLVPAGFLRGGGQVEPLDQSRIAEHVAHSWFVDYEGGKHPSEGETRPYATGREGAKYSWAKAPRYAGAPAETGPLAEMMVKGHSLFTDLVGRDGPSVFVREMARMVRPAEMMPAMDAWLQECTGDGKFYQPPGPISDGEGFGLTHAARGALGHWVKIKDQRITHYQIVTPTAWHASPRDSGGVRGMTEEALVGTPVKDPGDPVELGHVVRSFDHCLVCTVHMVSRGRPLGRLTVGA
jgi:hydrogenase large subunit